MKVILYTILYLFCLSSCISPLGKIIDSEKSSSFYYQPITGKVVYSRGGHWFEIGYKVLDADRNSFRPLFGSIGKDKNVVFYENNKQPHIDVNAFVVENRVMKDKKFVYKLSVKKLTPIKDADPNSFTFLKPNLANRYIWAKDDFNYYLYEKKVNVDYSTFKVINETIVADKDSIYTTVYSKKIRGIRAIDVVKGEISAITDNYARMGDCIIYYGVNKNKVLYSKFAFKKIDTIKVYSRYVIIANSLVLYQGQLFSEDVDSKTFSFVNKKSSYYFKDINNVYYTNRILSEADVNSFEVILRNGKGAFYAKDKNKVYWLGQEVKLANPRKFKYDTKMRKWTDGDYWFSGKNAREIQ